MIEKTNPIPVIGGGALAFHEVHSFDVSCDNVITICIGSWADASLAGDPALTTELKVMFSEWSPLYSGVISEIVSNHPEWTGAGPVKPSAHHLFDIDSRTWKDPRALFDIKASRWVDIKQARSRTEYAGFSWGNSIFDSDPVSQNRITGAVTLAQMSPNFTISWVLADNSVRALNQAEMLQVGSALGQHVASIFTKAAGLRAQIEAATTVSEVELIVW